MFNRRGARGNRRGIGAGVVSAFSPSDISGLVAWYDADSAYITKDGSGLVSGWADRGGSGHHYAQAAGANQPLWLASGPNGKPCVQMQDIVRYMTSDIVRPAPGTAPTLWWGVIREDVYVISKYYCGGVLGVYSGTAAGRIRQYNGGAEANMNSALGTATWRLVIVYFSGSTADYVQVGTTIVTGQNAGNIAGGTCNLGGIGSNGMRCSFAELGIATNDLSAGDKENLISYVSAKYGSGVVA